MPEKLIAAEAAGAGVGRPPAHPIRAYLGMSLATVFWATNAVAVKLALREVPQLATVALRLTLAAVALSVVHAANGGRFLLRRSEWGYFLRLGAGGLALSFLCFTVGLNYTSVSHAVFISALTPMAVLLFARWHGLERVTPRKMAGLLLSLAGVFSLATDQAQTGGQGPGWAGDLLVMASAGAFAYFTVGSKKIALAHPSLEFNALAFLVAALCVSPLLAMELARLPWQQISWVGWSGLLYSATLGSAGAYLIYFAALRLLPASRAAAFHYLQPVLATVLGAVIFDDRFTARFAVGAALILAGLWVAKRPS